MKKGTRESNPALELWRKIILDGRIYKLAHRHRAGLGIPKDGFQTSEEYDVFIEKFKKENNDKLRIRLVNNFVDESKGIIPYVGTLKEVHFRLMMIEFFYYNNVSSESFNGWKNSEMGVFIIENNKRKFPTMKEIPDGVYIKLETFSAINTIIKYVKNNKELIRDFLDIFVSMKNLEKPKRVKSSLNFKRNSTILALDEWSKKEIEKKFSIKAEYKDQAISQLMKDMGFKKITPQIVKAVKQRRRIR